MLLILYSNVIWHAYRFIAETKIFRLGVSLICLLYVKEEWISKKVYYRKTGIFTTKDHISDNSTQINIKFTFTVYKLVLF